MLPLIDRQKLLGIFIVVIDALGAYHFHAQKSRALLFAEQTKWQVCHACHWSEHQIVF